MAVAEQLDKRGTTQPPMFKIAMSLESSRKAERRLKELGIRLARPRQPVAT
jgi:hypothetical protein